MAQEFQVPDSGFGSYLSGILPDDIAVSAGAFAASMQQIRNAQQADFEKFSQVVASIETTKGLNQVNGTDVPTNIPLAKAGHTRTALGTGPNGGYTFSDFFGCMSGLPYMWGDIQSGITALQSPKLSSIYSELFLAVTWEQAFPDNGSLVPVGNRLTPETQYVTIQPYIPPTEFDPGQIGIWEWFYRIPASLPNDQGGGYGRGNAPAPTITLSNGNTGASVIAVVGKNKMDGGSNATSTNEYTGHTYSPSKGTYGRLKFIVNQGSWTSYGTNTGTAPANPGAPVVKIYVQAPPIDVLTVPASGVPTGGSNVSSTGPTSYWKWQSPMNDPVTSYISQANAEIISIKSKNPTGVKNLNTVYNAAGTQLTIEQRSRFTSLSPVPIVNSPIQPKADGQPGVGLGPTGYGASVGYGKDNFLNVYPDSLYTFVDALPELAQKTLPHMSAQTIDAISDMSTPGGQSAIAKQREERNTRRLIEAGIYQDNNVPGAPALTLEQMLLTNGTAPIAINGSGITINNINGFATGGFGLNSTDANGAPLGAGGATTPSTTFTLPAILLQKDDNNNIISPIPIGYTNPNTQDFIVTVNPASIPPPTPPSTSTPQGTSTTPGVDDEGNLISGVGSQLPENQVNNVPGVTNINQVSPIAELLAAENNNPNSQNLLGPAGNGTGPSLNPETNPAIDPALASLFPPQLTNPIAVIRVGVRLPVGIGSPINLGQSVYPGILTGLPVGTGSPVGAGLPVGTGSPVGAGAAIDLGQAVYPGSLAGTSPYNLLPNNLNTAFTSGTMLPASYSVPEAIEEVILCNCDCWNE